MRTERPELRAITITILLSTLALALAIVIGYAWWSTQQSVNRNAHEKVDTIAQFLENGMVLLPHGGADLDSLHMLMAHVGVQEGARDLVLARGEAVARQYGPSSVAYARDTLVEQVFDSGQDVTVVETWDGVRVVRRLKALEASERCLDCHEAAPGEILGVMDVSFDQARVQSVGPDFYRDFVLVSLLASVIAVLLVFLVFSRVNMGRRIESVTILASDIAAGDLDRRVAALPGTGMDSLAQSINEMAQSLQTHQAALARQQQELQEANRRLEVLVQEAHHRIKNNLQTVADLLALQVPVCPAGGGSCLKDSIQRVKSIAAVHELLSVNQAESTDIRQLARRLLSMSIQNVASPGQQIASSVEGEDLYLASKQATALALVLNELFNNAITHSFSDRTAGQIDVGVRARNSNATISVRDDGAGLPAGFTLETHEQLGLRIVSTLVKRELNGEFTLENNSSGATGTVSFPYSVNRAGQ